METEKFTPMIEQFWMLKGKQPESLILFRCGDFYETYSDDASIVSDILGITLAKDSTEKEMDGTQLRMAAFPYHALDSYLPKLIRAGHRIAICDQLTPTRTKELTKRCLTSKDEAL